MSDPAGCILDASSLVLLMKELGGGLVPRLGRFCVLDLTTYEMGSVLWKESHLSKRFSKEEVASLASTTEKVLTMVERIPMSPHDIGRTLELADREGLTFYDASYLQAAIDRGATLVTEDTKLGRAAKKHVIVKAAADL